MSPASRRHLRVLIVGGSDSGAGAGIQADLKTASALGCYATTVVTLITAQNTCGICSIEPVSESMVRAQIRSVMEDIGADAIKIGALLKVSLVETVQEELSRYPNIPLILDPVCVAKSGHRLIDTSDSLRSLLPRATLVTPNLSEVKELIQFKVTDRFGMEQAAHKLLALGPRAVLVKGGHLKNAGGSDCFLDSGPPRWIEGTWVDTQNTHGTGCTLSTAIACLLAHRFSLWESVKRAKAYVQGALAAAVPDCLGAGCGPVDHFWEMRR